MVEIIQTAPIHSVTAAITNVLTCRQCGRAQKPSPSLFLSLREVQYPRAFGIQNVICQCKLLFFAETLDFVARQPDTPSASLPIW